MSADHIDLSIDLNSNKNKGNLILLPVDRYRGEEVHYSLACLWDEIK